MTKKNKGGSCNTHDKLFRDLISHKKVSTEFFESYMPPEILERVDLSSLKHEKETFVDHDIGDGIVDTLFSVSMKNGERGYFYCVLEHQSRQEFFMAFRVLKYMLMIMQHHLKQHPKSKYLPYVMPFILYGGKEDYKVATSVLELFPDKDLGEKILTGNMQVISPYFLSDEALKEKLWSGMLQLVMKQIYDTNIIEFLELYRDSLKSIGNLDFIYIKRIIWYTLERGEAKNSEDIIEFFKDTFQDKREDIVTIADQLREQGKLIGIGIGLEKGKMEGIGIGLEKGKMEEKYSFAMRLLDKNLDLRFISEVTELSEKDILKLKKERSIKH